MSCAVCVKQSKEICFTVSYVRKASTLESTDEFARFAMYCPECGRYLGTDKPLTLDELRQMVGRAVCGEEHDYLVFENCRSKTGISLTMPNGETILLDYAIPRVFKHKPKEV